MTNKVNIAIDAMGGENSPKKIRKIFSNFTVKKIN